MEKIKYYKEIVLDGQEGNLKKGCNIFLEELSKNYEIFTKTLSDNQEKWKTYLNQENVIFIPQEIAIKSPTTIIDAPWGTGKTYFIEQVAKYFLDNNNKIDKKIKFKKIIILDTWKYSSMENVAIEVMAELFYILASKSKKLKETWVKIAKSLFNNVGLSWANKLLGTEFEKIKLDKSFEELLKELDDSKEIVPTLIFFDNVERLEEKSWDILKAIQKLSSLKNLCFILPMSLEKFNNNLMAHKNELPIEKYINLPYFKLEQNFIGLLKKQGFKDEEFCKTINSFLQEPLNDYSLSIRRAEDLMNHHKFFDIYQKEGEFLFLENFVKIWNAKESITKYLKQYLDDFLDSYSKQKIIFDDFTTLFNNNLSFFRNSNPIIEKYISLDSFLEEEIISNLNNLNQNSYYGGYRYNNHNQLNFFSKNFWYDWKSIKILEKIAIIKKNINIRIKELFSLNSDINNKILENTNTLNKNQKLLSEKNEEMKTLDQHNDIDKISINEITKNKLSSSVEGLEELIGKLNIKIDENLNEISILEDLILNDDNVELGELISLQNSITKFLKDLYEEKNNYENLKETNKEFLKILEKYASDKPETFNIELLTNKDDEINLFLNYILYKQ